MYHRFKDKLNATHITKFETSWHRGLTARQLKDRNTADTRHSRQFGERTRRLLFHVGWLCFREIIGPVSTVAESVEMTQIEMRCDVQGWNVYRASLTSDATNVYSMDMIENSLYIVIVGTQYDIMLLLAICIFLLQFLNLCLSVFSCNVYVLCFCGSVFFLLFVYTS